MSSKTFSAPSSEIATPARPAYPGVRRTRPTKLTAALILQICEQIQRFGVSDSEAGLLLDVPTSTMSDWKRVWPEFGDDLKRARALFWIARIRRIMEVRKKDGSYDWRVEAWLYRHAEVDGEGERLHRGSGRMPARVRRAVDGGGEMEGGREGETESGYAPVLEKLGPLPLYEGEAEDYPWPGGEEEMDAALANGLPDPRDGRWDLEGQIILTPKLKEYSERKQREALAAWQAELAAADALREAPEKVPNRPETPAAG